MSRAFVKEDVFEPVPAVRLVAPLPEGAVNYVTPRGLRLLREAVQKLEEEQGHELSAPGQAGLRQSLEELRYRALSAKVIDLSTQPRADIRFGAAVTLEGEDGRRSQVSLVGVDEADPASGRISFYSALGQALLGKAAGDTVSVDADDREVRWNVISVSYGGSEEE